MSAPRRATIRFFEMLGNFSFGDYFKRDAIKYAYTLLTEVYKLPADRLVFTVYENDDEAYSAWVEELGVDPKRVARMGPFHELLANGRYRALRPDLRNPLGQASASRGDDEIIPKLQAEDDRFPGDLESRLHAIQSPAGRSRSQRPMGCPPARARRGHGHGLGAHRLDPAGRRTPTTRPISSRPSSSAHKI